MIALKKKRLDGVRITGLDGFHAVAPYVMPKRTEAEVPARKPLMSRISAHIWRSETKRKERN